MFILDKYTPEEYATFWGCDPCYDRFPRIAGDGYRFYNFMGKERVTPEFLEYFIGAIDRTIEQVKMRTILDPIHGREEQEDDIQGLSELKSYVQGLLKKVENNPCVPA